VERAADAEIVLELDHDVLADQGLEERVEEHGPAAAARRNARRQTTTPGLTVSQMPFIQNNCCS
jgi:hypothetical protein